MKAPEAHPGPPRSAAVVPDRRTLVRLLQAAFTMVLAVGGALLLARYLRARAELVPAQDVRDDAPVETPDFPELSRQDPWADSHLARGLDYGPIRPVTFHGAAGWLAVASSSRPPDQVFAQILERQSVSRGIPSGTGALSRFFRGSAIVGQVPGGTFLMRLPLDLTSRGGALRTERGSLTLALRAGDGWDYLAFLFPNGLEFRAPSGPLEPPEESVLADLGRAPARHLLATRAMELGAVEGSGGPSVYVCARRPGSVASVASIAQEMVAEGWKLPPSPVAPDGTTGEVAVLERGREQVWIVGPSADADRSAFLLMVAGP